MIRRTLALAGLAGALACTTAAAAPVTVNLRVEGKDGTVFEGPVTTDVRPVDGGDGSGPQKCDGTNGNPSASSGPTLIGALEDAEAAGGLTWLGEWNAGFEDFTVRRIGSDTIDFNPTFWGQIRNFSYLQVGGCQQHVQHGDRLLFAFTEFDPSFNGQQLLELRDVPARTAVGEPFPVTVVQHVGDGTSAPAQGATVAGRTTGADGRATVSFDSPGVRTLKATKPGTVRSNAGTVCVYTPGSGGCGTDPAPGTEPPPEVPQLPATPAPVGEAPDTTAPRASIAGLANRTYRRPPRVLRGRVEEDRGIHQVYLRVRMIARGGCRWLSGRREVFTRPRTCARARYIRIGDGAEWSYLLPFSLPRGARYIVDVKVLDRALNRDAEQVRFRVAR